MCPTTEFDLEKVDIYNQFALDHDKKLVDPDNGYIVYKNFQMLTEVGDSGSSSDDDASRMALKRPQKAVQASAEGE